MRRSYASPSKSSNSGIIRGRSADDKEPGRVLRPLGVVAEGFEALEGAQVSPDAAGIPLSHEARQHKIVGLARGQAAVHDQSGLGVVGHLLYLVAPASCRCLVSGAPGAASMAGNARPTLLKSPSNRWHRRLACADAAGCALRTLSAGNLKSRITKSPFLKGDLGGFFERSYKIPPAPL